MVTHPNESSTKIVLPVIKMGDFYALTTDGTSNNFTVDIQGENVGFRGIMDVLEEMAYHNDGGTFTLNWNEGQPNARVFIMTSTLWRRLLTGIKTHFDYIGT